VDGPYAGAIIVHQRSPTPWWWLLVIALVVLPWGLEGHWLITGPVWVVIAAMLGWRYRRHRCTWDEDAPRMEHLHS
jgi:Na+-driven multidrug efflux pump